MTTPTPRDLQAILTRCRQRRASEERVCPGWLARVQEEIHAFTDETLKREGVDVGEIHAQAHGSALAVVTWLFTPPRPGAYPCTLSFTCERQGLTCRQEIAGPYTPRSVGIARLAYDDKAGDPVGWVRDQILAFLDHALRAN